jgi:hypothetical protein
MRALSRSAAGNAGVDGDTEMARDQGTHLGIAGIAGPEMPAQEAFLARFPNRQTPSTGRAKESAGQCRAEAKQTALARERRVMG